MRNEFAVAGYRWGHATLVDEFDLSDNKLGFKRQIQTEGTFFNPDTIYNQGPAVCLYGAVSKATGTLSSKFWNTFQAG